MTLDSHRISLVNFSCLESREYGRRDLSRWPRGTIYSQKLALTSPTSGGRSVGIVRSRTHATKFFFFVYWLVKNTITILTETLLTNIIFWHDNIPKHGVIFYFCKKFVFSNKYKLFSVV
jgi:hypothetical protein